MLQTEAVGLGHDRICLPGWWKRGWTFSVDPLSWTDRTLREMSALEDLALRPLNMLCCGLDGSWVDEVRDRGQNGMSLRAIDPCYAEGS